MKREEILRIAHELKEMTVFKHEVKVTFPNGYEKVIWTNHPESWDNLDKVLNSPLGRRTPLPISVTVRPFSADELIKQFEEQE